MNVEEGSGLDGDSSHFFNSQQSQCFKPIECFAAEDNRVATAQEDFSRFFGNVALLKDEVLKPQLQIVDGFCRLYQCTCASRRLIECFLCASLIVY